MFAGEGTVDVSHENNGWRKLPANKECNEPKVLNSHYLHHLNPEMRIIIAMRNHNGAILLF